ncbi:MAG TPA: FtsX-like permease family protein [Steroidobacteraceae bacterium]
MGGSTDAARAVKFFPLICAGLWRRPTRTILTGLCISIAFLLLGLLQGVNAGFAKAIEDAHRDLLVTNTRVRGGAQMPLSSKSKIQSIPGVVEVTQRANFLGTFGEPTANNRVSGPATEPEIFFRIRPFFSVPEESLSAMRQNRDGMLATPGLLRHFGWRVGDTVTLKSQILKTDGSTDWSFKIVGTFDARNRPGTSVFGVINYSYFDEYRVLDRGTAETFYERIADPTKAVATAAAIDRIFANSSHETRTRSDQVRAQYQAKQMGDVEFFTDAIMAAVLFTLAFLTGNTLRQSISERTPEFAVLKAFGWSDGRVLSLAYAEALLLYIPSAVLGLVVAYLAAPLAREDIGAVVVSPAVAMTGLTCAALLALLSATLPAFSLSRMSIVSALGRR